MYLWNLAEPEWISVPCDTPLTPYVICVKKKCARNAQDVNEKNIIESLDRIKSCQLKGIENNGACYYFLWESVRGQIFSERPCKQCLPLYNKVKTLEVYSYIFSATSMKHHFPLVIACDSERKLTAYSFYRHLNIIHNRRVATPNVGLVTYYSQKHNIPEGYLTFRCVTGEYISIDFVCDGKNDCKNDNTDEIHCTYSIENSSKNFLGKLQTQCLPLYYMTMDMICKKYQKKTNLQVTSKTYNTPIASIAEMKVNNISCMTLFMLSCLGQSSKCYSVTDVCKYFLHNSNELFPCENGGHLEKCRDFQCNMMFKCFESYCIPWSYRCDLKWDCPFGDDERNCLKQKCTYMYKCRQTEQFCLHLGNVCDERVDCPYSDDEMWCELKTTNCPQHCSCLLYAINCIGMSNNSLTYLIQETSYLSVAFSNFYFPNLEPIIYMLRYVIAAKLSRNRISTCYLFNFATCLTLDLSYNYLTKIHELCFLTAIALKSLSLNNNQIKTIHPHSFRNLLKIRFLNISSNPLVLIKQTLVNLKQLSLIDMSNISELLYSMWALNEINMAISNEPDICCMLSSYTICTPFKDDHLSCSDVLLTENMKIFFPLVFWLILVLNMISSVVNTKIKSASKGYIMIMLAINFSHCIFGMYLFIIWIADFSSIGFFFLYRDSVKFKYLCLIAISLILWSTLVAPMFIAFLSISRMMLTIHPVDTISKRKNYTEKVLHFLLGISFIFSTIFSMVFKSKESNFNLLLCIPFLHPSQSVLTFIVGVMQVIVSSISVVVHVVITKTVNKSNREVGLFVKNRRTFIGLARQLFILAMSNIICWLPVTSVYIATSLQLVDNIHVVIWSVVIGSSINPVIYPMISIVTFLKR